MSKKQKKRRDRRPNVPLSAGPVLQSKEPAAVPRATSLVEQFSADYTYVKQDLRRIGILAGSFIAILVILSFFI